MLLRQNPDLRRGRRPHHFATVQHQGTSHSIVLMVDEEVILVFSEGAHGQQELGQVVAIQGTGLGGEAAGQVCVPYASHTLHRHRMSVTAELACGKSCDSCGNVMYYPGLY